MRSRAEQTIIWGLHVSTEQKHRWKLLAVLVHMPVSRLINTVLDDWWDHHEPLIQEEDGVYKLSELLSPSSDKDKEPFATSTTSLGESEFDFLEGVRMNLSVRGVNANTRLYLKGMSASTGRPIYQILDEMVARAWQEQGTDATVKDGKTRGLRKTIKKILQKYDKGK